MKKCIIVIIAVLFSFLSVNMLFAAANTWTQKTDFGGQREMVPSASPSGARAT